MLQGHRTPRSGHDNPPGAAPSEGLKRVIARLYSLPPAPEIEARVPLQDGYGRGLRVIVRPPSESRDR